MLLTGGTGFVGSHFLFHRIQHPGVVHVLVRAATPEEGRARLIAKLHKCAESLGATFDEVLFDRRAHVVIGNLSEPHCGLDEDAIGSLREVRSVVHCAASLEFQDRFRAEIFDANVDGTGRLLDVVARLSHPHFYYVSTAYSAGRLTGAIPERAHPAETKHANAYEESKWRAERLVVERAEAEGFPYSILRPTVIIGPTYSCTSGGTHFGLYGFIRDLFQNRKVLGRLQVPVRLVGHSEAVLNLVPIDQVAYDMLYLTDGRAEPGGVYHLANSRDISLVRIVEMIRVALGLSHAVEFVHEAPEVPSPMQGLFDRRTSFYQGYYDCRKQFARSLPGHRSLRDRDLETYVATYVRELTSARETSIFERRQIVAPDGATLVAYCVGNETNPVVVLANAYGMPAAAMEPLARRLASRFRVITWETRWVPALEHIFDPERCDSRVHATDLLTILDAFGSSNTSVVGWSSGCQIALRAADLVPDRVRSAILMNPTIPVSASSLQRVSAFERDLRGLFARIAPNRRAAAKYSEAMYGDAVSDRGAQKQIAGLIERTDPFLLHLTSIAFRNEERLYRYANMVHTLFAEEAQTLRARITRPVLVSTGANDVIADVRIAREVAQEIPGARLLEDPTGDHFSHFYDPKLAERFIAFLEENWP